MKTGRRVDRILPWHYVISDTISAAIAWAALFVHRKIEVEKVWSWDVESWEFDSNYTYGIILVPIFWLGIYSVLGMYSPPRRLSLIHSDAADDLLCVDLGGRRIIKKKKNNTIQRNVERNTSTVELPKPDASNTYNVTHLHT